MGSHHSHETGYRPLSSGSPTNSTPSLPPVYADKYCSLSAEGLTIYWLHLWKSKSTFAIADLEQLTPANEIFPADSSGAGLWARKALKVKGWGLGGTGILWALAWRRAKMFILFDDEMLDGDFVITLRHWNTFKAGFSVEDPVKFRDALNEVRAELQLSQL